MKLSKTSRNPLASIGRTGSRSRCPFGYAHGRRKGSMLIEVIVASILMASLAAIFLPGLALVNQQRSSIKDDSLVLVELNNLAEKATVASTDSLVLSDWFLARYPEAKLKVDPVAADVNFQPADDAKVDDVLAFRFGYKLQVTIASETSNLPITRSLVVWPKAAVSEGVGE